MSLSDKRLPNNHFNHQFYILINTFTKTKNIPSRCKLIHVLTSQPYKVLYIHMKVISCILRGLVNLARVVSVHFYCISTGTRFLAHLRTLNTTLRVVQFSTSPRLQQRVPLLYSMHKNYKLLRI